jgi:nicotinic acid phosphoribosyltransferase
VTGVAPSALLTDKYELTMLGAALRDGTAHRRTTFEVFARRLPEGRRYGVVAGTGRFLEALGEFVFDEAALATVAEFLDSATVDYLRGYRFSGDIDGYAEGELYFPGSPVLSVTGTFAECVVLETVALSMVNHDSAVASAAARMVSAAAGRPLIEMGSRRPRAGGDRRGARRLPRRLRRDLEPRRAACVRNPGTGHRRACLHPAAHPRRRRHRRLGAGRVPRTGGRAGAVHHAAGRHL